MAVEAAAGEVRVVAHRLDAPLHDGATVVERTLVARVKRCEQLRLERARRKDAVVEQRREIVGRRAEAQVLVVEHQQLGLVARTVVAALAQHQVARHEVAVAGPQALGAAQLLAQRLERGGEGALHLRRSDEAARRQHQLPALAQLPAQQLGVEPDVERLDALARQRLDAARVVGGAAVDGRERLPVARRRVVERAVAGVLDQHEAAAAVGAADNGDRHADLVEDRGGEPEAAANWPQLHRVVSDDRGRAVGEADAEVAAQRDVAGQALDRVRLEAGVVQPLGDLRQPRTGCARAHRARFLHVAAARVQPLLGLSADIARAFMKTS